MTATLITGVGLVGAQVALLEQQAGRTPVLFDLLPRTEALSDFVDLEQCVVVRADLLNPLEIVDALKRYDVRRIVHTAAFPGLTQGGQKFPLATVRVNVLGTAHVLEAARLFDVERVVICSSAALSVALEGGEDNGAVGFENAYPRTSSIYATSKLAAEYLGLNYATTLGLDVVVVRFPAVFGPWSAGGGGPGTAEMGSWLRAALRGDAVEVPATRLEWVYSKDASYGAYLACWQDGLKDRVFNISVGETCDGHQLARALCQVAPSATVTVAPPQPDQLQRQRTTAMSTTRASTQLGFVARFSLPEALADYRDWILEKQTESEP